MPQSRALYLCGPTRQRNASRNQLRHNPKGRHCRLPEAAALRHEGELPLAEGQDIQQLLLTNKKMIGKQLGELRLHQNFGCTVTRVRRSGIDLTPSESLELKFADKLMVVGEKEGLNGFACMLGNNAKLLSDTDFFPIALGIVLGVIVGKLDRKSVV